MESVKDRKPIPYNEDEPLIQGEYYMSECGLPFTYDKLGNEDKPFVLDNGIRKDHIPISKDIPSSHLRTMANRDIEEVKQLASKGGTTSANNKIKRRTFKESFELFLSLGISESQLNRIDASIIEKIPEDLRKQLTQADLITLKQIELSQDGSDKASVFTRDTIGEKPTDRTEIQADIMTDGDRALIEKLSRRLQDN